MDQVYARVKRLRRNPLRRVLSDEKLFDMDVPNVSVCTEYDSSTLLDDGEWFKLSSFRDEPYCPDFLRVDLVSADIPELNKDQFESISYLMSAQNDGIFFQRIRPSSLLRRKLLVYGDAAVLEDPSNRIVINSTADAVFLPESGALLFRDLAAVSPMFPGIDLLYKEATDEQVREFLDNSFISSDLEADSVSKPNRKRIAMAMVTLKSLSDPERDDIFTYINEYCDGKLRFDAKAKIFTVKTDDELKMLIYGIEQRYYTTEVRTERRLANSIVKF